MAWGFRKSIKILPGVRLNLGKRGFSSVSVGPKGSKINVGKRGTFLTNSAFGFWHRVKLSGSKQPYGSAPPVWYCANCSLGNTPLETNCRFCHALRPPQSSTPPLISDDLIKAGAIIGVIAVTVGLFSLIGFVSYLSNGGRPALAPQAEATAPPPQLSSPAETLNGKVTGVVDGDTIMVLVNGTATRVRLAGIDAPEPSQDFSAKAKKHLSSLVFGKTVTIKTKKKDQYGRTVGQVFVGESDVNLAMVAAGLAWHYREYIREQSPADAQLYTTAEETARASKSGLWSSTLAVAPWDYRRPQPIAAPVPFVSSRTESSAPGSTGSRGEYGPRQSGLIRGPRGGCYYINSRGNKTYVDRSLCD